jgi:hypothetical protein
MARSKEQIDQLKSLVDQLRSEGLSTDEIQAKVDEQKAKFDAEQTTIVKVTDETQTTPTEGKTNDTVETGAPAVSETGQAPESTELYSASTLLELQKDANKYESLDNSKEAIAARRKLNNFEDQLISQQPIDLEEVVVTGFGDNTPITREEWSKLDNRLKNQNKYKNAFAKGELTKADVQRAQYDGYLGEGSGTRSLIDEIATANANIPEQEITDKTYDVYFEKTPGGGASWIDERVETFALRQTGEKQTRPATKEEKEQRVYDAAIAAGLNNKGAKDYVSLYNQYQENRTLDPLNDYQKESIPTYKQQALGLIENRNKELVANNYNEDVQDLASVLLKETPEGKDLTKVINDLTVGGATLVAEEKRYDDNFNVIAPKIEKLNSAIQRLDDDINVLESRAKDFSYPVTMAGQETGRNIISKLQEKINERNALATGPEAQSLMEENLKLADQRVQLLNMFKQYEVNLQKYDDLEDLDQTLVALDKDYRFSTRAALNIEQSFGGSSAIAGAYTARAGAFLVAGLAEITQSGAGFNYQNVVDSKIVRGANALIDRAVNYNQGIDEKMQALPAPITVDEIRKGKASFGAWASDSTASAAPTLLTIFGPQAVGGLVAKGFTSGMSVAQKVATTSFNKGVAKGMAKVSGNLFGIQTGGQTLQSVEIAKKLNPKKIEGLKAEIEKTKDPIVKQQLENQIVSLENSLNKSTFQTGVSGLVTGAITKYSEQLVTLKLFNDFNRVAKKIGRNKFIKELKDDRVLLDKNAVSKAWIPQTLELGGVVGGGLIKENAQEALESILDQGIVRNVILGEDVNVFEEINEDLFANTSFATLMMLSGKTVNNANNIIKQHTTTQRELSKYQSLTRDLISAQDLPTPDRIKKSKQILLDLGLQDIVNISKLNTLTPSQIKEIGEIEFSIKKLSKDATALGNSVVGLPTESEIKALQNLQEQSDLLKNRKDNILSVRSKRNQEKLNELKLDYKTNPEALFHLSLFDSSNVMADAMIGKGNEIYFFEEDTADLEKFKGRTITYKDDNGVDQEADAFDMVTSGSQLAYSFDNVVVVDVNQSINSIASMPQISDGKFAAVSALHEVSHLRNKNKKIKFEGDSAEALTNKKAVTEAINMLDGKLEQGAITQKDYDLIKRRLALYENDGDYEEFMQVLSDAVNLGMLNKSDFNPDSTLNSFKGLFNNITNKVFGDQSEAFVQFNTGSDVYNYIDSFRRKAVSGIAIADVDEEDKTIKASKIYQEVETFKDDLVNEQTKDATAFLIADKLQNEVDRRLKIDVDQETREDITRNFLFDDRRGLLGLLKNYDPARNESVMGYLNSTTPGGKLLDTRLIEFYENDPRYNQIVQSTTDEAVQRKAEQVTAEEVSVAETPTKPEAKTIDPFRVMPNVKETATAEVQKNIKDKGVDVTEVTYKELKDVAPYQTVADFFNIPVSRIKNPKDNLRKSDDVANIQRWILKNEPTLKNLFTEANREVVEIKEGNRVIRKGGEPTAIPRNLLNKFYNKRARVGNNFQWTLKPYDRTTFLEAVGIKDGKVDPNFTPRAAEAQTIKGILDMYTRNLGNVAARDIIETREDIAPAEKVRAKAEVAKGKPRLMFAKSGITSDMNKTVEKAGGKVLSKTVEDNQTFRTFLVDELTKFLGSETNRIIKPSDVAGAGNSAVGNRKTSGAKGRGFRFIGDINRTQKFIKETEDAIAAGEVMDLQVLRNEIKDKASLLSKEQIEDVIAATSSQTKASMARNETNKDKIKRGKRLILDALFRAVQADIKNLGPIRELLYNANANSSFGRKFATVTSIESNLKPKQKTWEEHVFQFGNWANRTLQAYGTKNPDIVNSWLKWAEDNYYQEVTGRDTQGIVDDNYPGWKAKFEEHPYLKEKLNEAFETGDFSQVPPSDIRKYNEFFTLDPNTRSRDGVTDAERYNVAVDKKFESNPNVIAEQGKLIYQQFIGEIDATQAENQIKEYIKIADSKTRASVNNNNENSTIKFSKQVPNQEVLDNLSNADKAMANARNPEAPVKKIRVFDFDDTLARSNSKVLYEMPDGTTGTLNATQFAQKAGELEEQGAKFDFSEFSKVVDGKRGPVFKAIENIVKARGAEDVFILTARPANAAGPIKEFMDALGVNLPIENIVGLGDGKAEAKARWMTGKAAEGYNDFFFVDDAYKNVKAVQDALDVFDVKSKTQQAKVKFSKKASLDKDFNNILEQTTGIASEKEYKRVKAEVAGASRGLAIRGISYSAQDFVGLLYETLGKGDLGDRQMAWYKTHVLNPYGRAMNDIDNARLAMMNDYKSLKKQLGLVPKNLRKKIPGEPFTNEQAARVYIWNKQGMEVPGISKSDLKDLTEHVENNAELKVFADQLIAIQKGDEYAKPKQGWPAGSITTDLLESINTTKRAKYLEQWQENVDVIFSEKNMNKLEAAYGKKYRVALENMLERMKTGRNRRFSDDSLTGRFTDWLQGSIGTIMFFNTRSALLQTISSINFVNFTDNNPLAAAKAFGNQKQYWSDFVTLINSDFLKARRSGLRMNVNEADIADMAKKGGPRAVINKLLQLGFAPTQIADSFAIASGGATFYRNRINTYKKQGLSQQEAEAKAFEDFRENAEESQQSARPDRISMQQAGGLGRLILAFQNTPSQYARIIDKSVRDLKNGRGDAKTNISKIIYYSTVQNLLFNALQQALFAFAFGDEEPEDKEKEKKYVDIANSMMDSLLRGTGIAGGILSVGKNAILRIVRESEKARPNYEKVGADLLKIAPPVSSKLSKINQAARSYKWDKEKMKQKGWSLDNPAYLAGANVISALTNVPLDRGIKKANNVVNATDSDLETWERLALLGGWQDWEIGVNEETKTNKPQPRKTKPRSRKTKTRKTTTR